MRKKVIVANNSEWHQSMNEVQRSKAVHPDWYGDEAKEEQYKVYLLISKYL